MLLGVAAVVTGAVVAVGVLVLASGDSGSGSVLTAPATVAPAVKRFPSPPPGAFVTARSDDAHALALAVSQQPGAVALQASDLDENGNGTSGLHVSFAVTSKSSTARQAATACGPGCYRASVQLDSHPLEVQVRVVRAARTTTWNVSLPATWPAADATTIVRRATATWKQLRSLRYRERLASDDIHSVTSSWQIVAPDRLAYQIEGGSQAVIIGLHRWDRPQGGAWVKSSAIRLHQPEPFWVSWTDAHVVSTGTLRGRPVWNVSFFDPRTPGWFLAAIDRTSYRTLDVRMTATAHFMHDSYSSFNTSIKIDPPQAG